MGMPEAVVHVRAWRDDEITDKFAELMLSSKKLFATTWASRFMNIWPGRKGGEVAVDVPIDVEGGSVHTAAESDGIIHSADVKQAAEGKADVKQKANKVAPKRKERKLRRQGAAGRHRGKKMAAMAATSVASRSRCSLG